MDSLQPLCVIFKGLFELVKFYTHYRNFNTNVGLFVPVSHEEVNKDMNNYENRKYNNLVNFLGDVNVKEYLLKYVAQKHNNTNLVKLYEDITETCNVCDISGSIFPTYMRGSSYRTLSTEIHRNGKMPEYNIALLVDVLTALLQLLKANKILTNNENIVIHDKSMTHLLFVVEFNSDKYEYFMSMRSPNFHEGDIWKTGLVTGPPKKVQYSDQVINYLKDNSFYDKDQYVFSLRLNTSTFDDLVNYVQSFRDKQ